MSRRDLARAAGLSYPYVAELENGTKSPSVKAMGRLEAALELEPGRLSDFAGLLAEAVPGDQRVATGLAKEIGRAQDTRSSDIKEDDMAFGLQAHPAEPNPKSDEIWRQLQSMTPTDRDLVASLIQRLGARSAEPTDGSFAACLKLVNRAYQRLGHELGFRFLTSPRRTLENPRVVLITLNPGGDHIPQGHPSDSSESGSAYLVESWGDYRPGQAPLQRQVQALFQMLEEPLEDALSGHFVPFRSPTWDALPNHEESLALGERIWSELFKQIDPNLVICMDRHSFSRLPRVMNAGEPVEEISLPTGWGRYNADIVRFETCTLLRIPHLSRFRLFGSAEREPYLRAIVEAAR
jgi:transcriptional regulator with XRE-family HTH domain